MHKMGAGIAFVLLVVVISFYPPNAALAFRLGPFHLGLPFFGHSLGHRHRPALHPDHRSGVAVYDSTESPGAAGNEPTQTAAGPASALLYPGLALPIIYDDVFWPTSSSLSRIGYDAIFQAAFGKAAGWRDRRLCQPDRGSAVVERIGSQIRPSAAQRPLLQRLGGALAMASGFLARFCPKAIPSQPVARLQLAETQLEALTMALDIIHPPLKDLEESLNPDQQARLAAIPSAPSTAGRNAAASAALACGATPATLDRAIDELNQSVQPSNDAQRVAVAAAKDAFGSAASDLAAQCPTSLPATPSERLEATQSRLDAEWRAVLTIRVALENLESGLSNEQRVRVNALGFASERGDHR